MPLRREQTLIGRSAYCSIVLDNTLASRRHCELRMGSDGLFITDLSSRNGTFVNEEPLRGTRQLKAGDVIRIGSDVLEVAEGGVQSARSRLATDEGAGYVDPEPTTEIGVDLVDVVESLAAAATNGGDISAEVADKAFRALLAFVASGASFDQTRARRAVQAAKRIAGCFPGSEREEWLANVCSALDAAPR